MKNFCLISVLFFYLIIGYGQTQMTLTFQAKDSLTQNSLSLDSVNVKNLSENCDTTLYDAVSVLNLTALWPVGFAEGESQNSGSLIMKQNVPNPFQGSTLVRICLKKQGALNLHLYSSDGTKLAHCHGIFEKGWHLFRVSTNGYRLMTLNAFDNTTSETIKILSAGMGVEGEQITWQGLTGPGAANFKSFPMAAGFIFYLGNQLQYTAYVAGFHAGVIYDSPVASDTYTFAMLPLSLPSAPYVSTSPVTNITQTSATSGGDVTADGGAPVTVRGVCWGLASAPTTSGSHTTDGSGTGIFVSNLTSLTPNTPYYLRAYATNSAGTSYGSEMVFSTPGNYTLPVVTTSPVTSIAQTTATSGGNVTGDGGAFVSARGVCWGTSPNPTIAGSFTTDGTGTGPFTSMVTGLAVNTTYYIRAYATNIAGTAYGAELIFNTLSATIPAVTTTPASNIGQTAATSGGNITSDGGTTVTARGVCWSTTANPTTAGSHTTDGSGTGTFISNLTGLALSTPYYYRAYATNATGTAYGAEMTFTTLGVTLPTVSTTPASNITQTTATSGGNITSDGGSTVTVRGVCWSTMSNPSISGNHTTDGSGTGTFISNLTGLTLSTSYYIRAYATNSLGTAYGNELTFITPGICGTPITITHMAGAVAPVTKTTTYGTVSNIPGEPAKCWITSNLGSDHQATAFTDDTEASAGWYWQFNRSQGYKHDGTNRTPNTTWITNIMENSDWTAANDPCAIELGGTWRIPTKTEWTNVDNTGGWTNWVGPWNSDLKLHAAGSLFWSTGALTERGGEAKIYSSKQEEVMFDMAYHLLIFGNLSQPGAVAAKSWAASLRCIFE